MSDKFQFHLYPHMSPELPMLWCLSQVKIGETLEVRMGWIKNSEVQIDISSKRLEEATAAAALWWIAKQSP